MIAAVYHNRLRVGMLLQADPTVQYARGQHTNRVRYRDLEIHSPYNTYKRAGLPPGPIGSPGAKSIEAALFPANVPYLYFVAHADGHHEFRTTFAQHVAAIRMLRQAGDSVGADSRSAAAAKPAAKAPAKPVAKRPIKPAAKRAIKPTSTKAGARRSSQ